MKLEEGRVARAKALVELNLIKQIAPNIFIVNNHTVNKDDIDNKYVCDCPDNTYRYKICKHIIAVMIKKGEINGI